VFIDLKVETTNHWEMTVPTIYEKEGIFYVVTAFEKMVNVVKFVRLLSKQ